MNRFSSLLCAAPVIAFAACGGAPPYAAQQMEDDVEQDYHVVVADAELNDVIRIGRPMVDRVPYSNQLRVLVPIRNIDDEPIQVLVQVSFLDASKRPLGDETNRQVKLIASGQTITHTALSKLDSAQDWTMRIDWNR